jgi:hypothetical protein
VVQKGTPPFLKTPHLTRSKAAALDSVLGKKVIHDRSPANVSMKTAQTPSVAAKPKVKKGGS